MNLEKHKEMKSETKKLIRELKKASDECWAAKVAIHDIAKKHAPLCVRILNEVIGDIPHLNNQRLEKRKQETDGRGVLDPDFWSHENMVISLWEHIQHKFDLWDDSHEKK